MARGLFRVRFRPRARQITLYPFTPTFTTDQEGYRWRDDDGSESTATFLQAQDVDITRAKSTNTRMRVLVDYELDPPTQTFAAQYRKVGDPESEWRDIPLT